MNKPANITQCPCGSHLNYQDCCHRFHTFETYPKTATQLMRSRYSAFACLGNTESNLNDTASNKHSADWLSYLEKTHVASYLTSPSSLSSSASSQEERAQLEQFAKQNKWIELRIIDRAKGQKQDNEGMVEFIAIHQPKQSLPESPSNFQTLHEKSQFKRIDGKWQYVDGDIYPTSPSQAKSISSRISRNDPCWCDSGKKRKKCHPS